MHGQTWVVSLGDCLAAGDAALAAGRWDEARGAFAAALAHSESAEARLGLASALWWLGENEASVAECTRAYSLFRRAGDIEHSVQCALWLAITYKANFANYPAANGWIGRADRLLVSLDPGPLHGHRLVARAYRMPDLARAEELTRRAVALAHAGRRRRSRAGGAVPARVDPGGARRCRPRASR